MNEKFFDLKKEKQDRIINATMKVFAMEGYAHASTDEMVREAHISKGLLFHYFISKLSLYAFLYDYAVRFVTLELSRNVPDKETDYFRLQEALLQAWSDAMHQYPYIRLFLKTAQTETDAKATEKIGEKRASFTAMLDEMEARVDKTAFRTDTDADKIRNIVSYTLDGLLTDADKSDTQWQERFLKEANGYLSTLKQLSYGGAE